MTEGTCSACGGAAEQDVNGAWWHEGAGGCGQPGARFVPAGKAWPPRTETKGPLGRLETK